jgi:hypothetical protein
MCLRPFALYCSACLGILFVFILCTCFSHFSWYCFITFTIFSAPLFSLIYWFFSLSSFIITSRRLYVYIYIKQAFSSFVKLRRIWWRAKRQAMHHSSELVLSMLFQTNIWSVCLRHPYNLLSSSNGFECKVESFFVFNQCGKMSSYFLLSNRKEPMGTYT